MKYYSEILDEFFKSEEELNEAEREKKKAEDERQKKSAEISLKKKQLAKAIDVATEQLNAAYESYEIAKKRADERLAKAKEESTAILKKANEEYTEAIRAASDEIKAKQADRLKAIREFNSKYGTYTTTLTGDAALREMRHVESMMEDCFSQFPNLFRGFIF